MRVGVCFLVPESIDSNMHIRYDFIAALTEELPRILYLDPRDLYFATKNQLVDAILLIGTLHGADEFVMDYLLRKKTIPTLFWSWEHPYDIDLDISFMGFFDLIFSIELRVVHEYSNRFPIHYLPLAAVPLGLERIEIRYSKICHIGTLYPNRQECLVQIANEIQRQTSLWELSQIGDFLNHKSVHNMGRMGNRQSRIVENGMGASVVIGRGVDFFNSENIPSGSANVRFYEALTSANLIFVDSLYIDPQTIDEGLIDSPTLIPFLNPIEIFDHIEKAQSDQLYTRNSVSKRVAYASQFHSWRARVGELCAAINRFL